MKLLLRYFLVLLFLVFYNVGFSQNRVNNYINKYQDLAVEQMKNYRIPASIILGVSIVESAAGQSKLAKQFHNYFGIKGSSTNSVKKLGYKSAYKEYDSDTASYEHFCRVLQKKKFYSNLKGEADYSLWLQKMNAANYSTDKQKWVSKVAAVIKKYKLYEFDEM